MIKLYKSTESEISFPMAADPELVERVGGDEEVIEKYRETADASVLGFVPSSVLRVVVRPLTYAELLTLEESAPYAPDGAAGALEKALAGEQLDRDEQATLRGFETYQKHVELAYVRRGVVRFEQNGQTIETEALLKGVRDRHLLSRIVSEAAGYVARVTRGPDPEGK